MMRKLLAGLAIALPMTMLLIPSDTQAQGGQRPPTGVDEEALVRRITEQVMKELQKGDFLQQQIDLGIQAYITRQRNAQARAEAERAHAANRLAEAVKRASPERDHIYGSADARISLIEYSDFECPYCKRFHPNARQAVDAYGGKLNWVYRHFPLSFHDPAAHKEAEASECAAALGGNAAFWRYADALYERTRSNGNGFPLDGLAPLAVELGLDGERFGECLKSERFAKRVNEDLDDGQAIGIAGTPGNVLLDNETGRVRVVPGAVPLPRLREEVDALLSAAE